MTPLTPAEAGTQALAGTTAVQTWAPASAGVSGLDDQAKCCLKKATVRLQAWSAAALL
jgi:hypothetical protein